MQQWFVGERAEPAVSAVRFEGASDARPAPGVLDVLDRAATIVICPSNPVISIGPILAVPGVRELLVDRRDRVVAVSPIVGGAPVKGPADRMLRELGHPASVVGVSRLYAGVAGTLVIDEADASQAAAVEDCGLRCVVAPTVMHGAPEAATLARVVLAAPVAR